MARMARSLSGTRRAGLALAGLLLTGGLASGAVLMMSPGAANEGPSSGKRTYEIVIICESGTVTGGGIETSSAVAKRVPAGTPIPPGCRAG